MKKENIYFIVLGVLFIFTPFFIKIYSVFKLIAVLIGIILTSIGLIANTDNKIYKVMLFPIMLFAFIYLVDYYSFIIIKKVPVMAIEYKSSDKVSTYNSLLYRVYKCDKSLVLDKKYKKNYACDNNDVPLISVNDFLESNVSLVYSKEKNKFVHLKGRISKIIGDNSIEISPYEGNIGINGYVSFIDNKKVVIKDIKVNPSKYYIFDEIEVIGLVSSFTTEENTEIIYLTNVKIIDNHLYDEYEIMVNNNNSKEISNMQNNVYYLGIENIYYKYDSNNIYDLNYILSDKRESIDNMVSGKEYKQNESMDRIYNFDSFNIVRCANEKTIFVNKNYKINDDICE